ncbi:50S ribosomal protein L33 [bacterium]|nr:50S ribosomal protein L33 [bacterium]
MAKGKGNRIVITMECTTCKTSVVPGVSRYTTEKNKKNDAERLEVMKYCRYERKHTLHKETR